jgi:hypothetical protein
MSNLDANGDGKFDLDEAPDDLTGAFGMGRHKWRFKNERF